MTVVESNATMLPLVQVLEQIVTAAQLRKNLSGIDDEAVAYGRLAYAALEWMKADNAGDIETAEKILKKIQRTKL